MRFTGHIVVVDDSPDCLGMLVAALRLHGLSVIGGRRPGAGARIPAFLASAPRVVLYDVPPPYELELEAFRELRRTTFPEAAVFLTTTELRRLQRWLTEGEVCGVFMKPYDLTQLVAAIRKVLGETKEGGNK